MGDLKVGDRVSLVNKDNGGNVSEIKQMNKTTKHVKLDNGEQLAMWRTHVPGKGLVSYGIPIGHLLK